MLNNLRLRGKFLLAFLFLGITPLAIVGYITFTNSSTALSEAAFAQLTSIREIKKAQILNVFATHQRNMNVLLETVRTLRQAALEKFQSVQESQQARLEEYFQISQQQLTVFSSNQTVITALMQFGTAIGADGAIDDGRYAYFDNEFAPSLIRFKETFGYDDLMLINATGVVVYALKKDADLGQNIVTGDLKDSSLGKHFPEMLEGPTILDFEPYPPSQNQHIGFLGAPIVFEDETIGAIVIKLTAEAINRIVQTREGMGMTGETFLVRNTGQAIEYRSDRVVQQGRIGETVATLNPDQVFSGAAGSLVEAGSSGQIELLRYAPLNLPGLNWVIVTTMSLEEVLSPKLDGETEDFFTRYLNKYGYEDLFLIHPSGNIFYSVKHEADYQTNILTGQYSATGFGKMVTSIMQTKTFGLADIEAYAPSNGKPAGFMGQPLLTEETVELVVALQFPIDGINTVMLERTGMRSTGETYLVGADGLLRSDSFLDPVNHSVAASLLNPEQGSVQTSASQQALSGQTGQGVLQNYLGKHVLAAYTPVQIGDITWALIAEIDTSEALAAVNRLSITFGIVTGLALLAIVIGAFVWSNYISHPMTQAMTVARKLAEGDFSVAVQVAHADEIGDLFRAFQEMQTKIAEVVLNVKTTAQDVAQRSREMNIVAEQMSEGASQQAAASQEVSSSMEEMAANIRQTADNAKITENMAIKSADDAREGNRAVIEIIHAMEVIAARISIVQEIASQTNLLSLNAAIEAAKAQEYGKGFSVVAASVRDLARQSRSAADEIRALVHSCVTLSAQAGEVLQRLVPNSEKTAELVQDINAASQEQSNSVEHVNLAIQQLDMVTQHNAATAEELTSTAESLTTQADGLQQVMAFFTVAEALSSVQTEEDDVLRMLQGLKKDRLVALLHSALSEAPTNAASPKTHRLSTHSVPNHRGEAHSKTLNDQDDNLDQEFEHF